MLDLLAHFAGLFVDYLCHECVKVIIFKIIARVTVTVLALSLLSVCGDRKTNSLQRNSTRFVNETSNFLWSLSVLI